MANLSKGTIFSAADTVTATKLNNLVDNASITGIVNADIAAGANIDASKLNLGSSGYLTTGGNFTITGAYTYDTFPITASEAPDADYEVANKKYVDDNVATLDAIGNVAAITPEQGDLLYYDGTNWNALAPGTAGQFLKTQGAAANPAWGSIAQLTASSVGQSELKTTTGESSVSIPVASNAGSENGTYAGALSGGSYGFYPNFKVISNEGTTTIDNAKFISSYSGESYTARFFMHVQTDRAYNASWKTNYGYAQQRYVTASGHDHWIFLLVDKETKNVISSYQAPDHPSANQGDATELDIPHPFGSYDPAKHEIVVVDNADLQAMIQKKKQRRRKERGVSLLQVINENYLIDDTKRPKYNPREIVKIDEEGDLEGETIKTMKTPDWAKIMISNNEISLKKRMVEKLPDDILFKKMVARR